jgi:hypothetical protein
MLALWLLLLTKNGTALFVIRCLSAPCNLFATTSRGIHFSFY